MNDQKPIYLQIADYLRSMIEVEKLADGTALPTDVELCQKFGTTRMTAMAAYRQLNTDGLVQRIRGKGTFVRRQPQQLNRDKSQRLTWGYVSKEPESSFEVGILHGISDSSASIDASLMLRFHDGTKQMETHQIQQMMGSRLNGIIVKPNTFPGQDVHRYYALRQKNVPIVFLDWSPFPSPMVFRNEQASGYLCTKHFLQFGRKKIIYLSERKNPSEQTYIAGFRQAMEEFCLPFSTNHVINLDRPLIENSNFESQLHSIISADPPRGILCSSDYLAFKVCRYLFDLGFKIPQDISVICCKDGPHCSLPSERGITAASFSYYDMGYSAGILLRQNMLMDSRDNNGRVNIKPKLVFRETCEELNPSKTLDYNTKNHRNTILNSYHHPSMKAI